jgi:hypothetical protein
MLIEADLSTIRSIVYCYRNLAGPTRCLKIVSRKQKWRSEKVLPKFKNKQSSVPLFSLNSTYVTLAIVILEPSDLLCLAPSE